MTNILTMTDAAYNCMCKRKKEIEFPRLWEEVCRMMKIPAELQARKKSQFYSELMLDNRFASLKGNKWDLRSRRKFEEVHISTDELALDGDDDETETEEDDGIDIPKDEDDYS
jgi:DNA-directed RNA polymerase subunit delta